MNTQRFKGTTAIGMAFLFIVIGLSAPLAMAAKFKLDGGFVTLGEDKVIRLTQASGRYPNLGKNYYRTATIGCTAVRNISATGRSGQLSLEYWALPFFTSKTGKPLMSALLPPIQGGKKLSNVSKVGPAAYYNADGYVQLRLYEFSAGKWVLRASKLIGDLEPL